MKIVNSIVVTFMFLFSALTIAAETPSFLFEKSFLWKQTKAEESMQPQSLQGGYQLYNEIHFFKDGYYVRQYWRINPNNNLLENGAFTNGSWKFENSILITQEVEGKTAYYEDEYKVGASGLTRTSEKYVDSSNNPKTRPISKNIWTAADDSEGLKRIKELLASSSGQYMSDYEKSRLDFDKAKANASKLKSWRD